MRILLTMNLPYFPAHGGANKSNRFILEALAQRHAVRPRCHGEDPSPHALGQLHREVTDAAAGPEDEQRLAGRQLQSLVKPAEGRDPVRAQRYPLAGTLLDRVRRVVTPLEPV